MNSNNETNIIRNILNEAFTQTPPTDKSVMPPKDSSIFTPVSNVPAPSSTPTPDTPVIQTTRPMSVEEIISMIKKTTKQAEDFENQNFLNNFKDNMQLSKTAKTQEERNSAFNKAMSDLDAHLERSDKRQQEYKDWRAKRAAAGAMWAKRGEARDKINAVKKENEQFLSDFKANLEQSRKAKTPEERKAAFNMAMTNIDTFNSAVEARHKKIDADRTSTIGASEQSNKETDISQLRDHFGRPIEGMDAPAPTNYYKKNPELWEKRKQAVARLIAAKTPEERQRYREDIRQYDSKSESWTT